MKVRVSNWIGNYEMTLSDKKMYMTVYLTEAEAQALVDRLNMALKRREDKK